METYQEVLNYIHSRPKKHRSASLANMRRILTALGEPQTAFKGIHVTGTNGKGSVTQILSALILDQGFKVGTFMSPFIQRFNERMQVDLKPISDEDLVYWTNEVWQKILLIRQTEPTFELTEFELVTAIMFTYFRAEKIEIAVIEVGIGGTHDKTNVFTPLLSVITTVGLDHLQLIGPTLEDVAIEKSGVIKAQRPVIIGKVPETVNKIFQDRAQAQDSPLYQMAQDFQVSQVTLLPDYSQTFNFTSENLNLKTIKIRNIARFEVDNMAVALMAFSVFCQEMQVTVPAAEIKRILKQVTLMGRLEVINTEPFIVLDGAHNPPAMSELLASIQRDFPNTQVHVVAAFMKDKAIEELLKILHQPRQMTLYLTTLAMPRAAEATDLTAYMRSSDQYFATWQDAFYAAYHNLASENELILICGSIYLVSEVRHFLLEGGQT
ncbi:bifunctional folylpolyglutamate synthase/dihydrofolate synthase [Agrilactobacillus yilanensis]|uniref:tetrahydrofolate synthase n=1 Tax=Agrilactobacillus yilanensis TaxID=2485997 RepID=A0ABW4J4H1_9LACO|nr:folylpolyglutamate synthase/dihydrofolate synthase family protein [Agrilactobacillus yilanensis]